MKSQAEIEFARLLAAEKAEQEREARAYEWQREQARSAEFFRREERERLTDLAFVI